MSRNVKIALIQQHAKTDIMDNLDRGVMAMEEAAKKGAQIVAFSELAFSTFYPQHTAPQDFIDLAETIPGSTTNIFSQLARKLNVIVILNLLERKGDQTFDASPVINSDGKILGVTRMVHVIEAPYFHEKGYYTPSIGENLVHKTALGNIGIAICYDRHFPEYMRILTLMGAELVVVPQAGAIDEWTPGLFEAEMQVASFQNGYYTALCNRVGEEESLTFEGKSFVTAPDGRIMTQAPAGEDHILYADLDLDEVNTSQASLYFLPDRREEIYKYWETEVK